MATIQVDAQLMSAVESVPILASRLASQLGKDCVLTTDHIHGQLDRIRSLIETVLTSLAHGGNSHLLGIAEFKVKFLKLVSESKNVCERMRLTERLLKPYLNSTRLQQDCASIMQQVGNIDMQTNFHGLGNTTVQLGGNNHIQVDQGSSVQRVVSTTTGVSVTEGPNSTLKLQAGITGASAPAQQTTHTRTTNMFA